MTGSTVRDSDLIGVAYSLDTGTLKSSPDDFNAQQILRAIALETPPASWYSKRTFACIINPREGSMKEQRGFSSCFNYDIYLFIVVFIFYFNILLVL